tara:strand:- start:970 stop:1482 length:513 start_codon:yes stop_codon:yes gene_type:complete
MKKIFLVVIFIFSIGKCYADNKIAYIDINYVLNNSTVGKSISEHIKKIKKIKNTEFVNVEKKLLDKEKDIIKKKNIIEKSEFENQVNLLRSEINEYRNKKNEFNDEIDKKKIKYTKIVLNTLNQIISKYVEENSIIMVFPKKNIVIAKKNLDITDIIMDLLNIQLIKIEF